MPLSKIVATSITDDAITSAKIADDAVVAAAIADGAVGSAAIADDAVVAAAIADDAVVAAAIADNAVLTAAINADAVTAAKIATNAVVADGLSSSAIQSGDLPAGTILQVKETHVNGAYSQAQSAGTVVDITQMSVTITPSSTSSKIFLMGCLQFESSVGGYNQMALFRRGSTSIGHGAASGSRGRGGTQGYISYYDSNNESTLDGAYLQFLDSPSTTSATTYKLAYRSSHAHTLYLNRTVQDSNDQNHERCVSSIVAMEVAG